jgi:hypothetical protein
LRLFCLCGAVPARAGLCLGCYERRRHSRRFFGGRREAALARDGHACSACGARERLAVHHRRPGDSRLARLSTLCAACHARLHRTAVKRRPFPPALLALWREWQPGRPEQLELPFAAAESVEEREARCA